MFQIDECDTWNMNRIANIVKKMFAFITNTNSYLKIPKRNANSDSDVNMRVS